LDLANLLRTLAYVTAIANVRDAIRAPGQRPVLKRHVR
jgi:hypothetical protein